MNQDQKKYLLKRLDDITAAKRREIYASLPSIDIIPFLKKLKPIVFNINKKASELIIRKEYDQVVKDNKSIGQKKEVELERYVVGLKDEIMLGDSKKALEQLAQFEKMKF